MKKIIFTVGFLVTYLFLSAQCFDEANVYSFDFEGHTYKIVKENKTWMDAIECAVENGGYLLEINNQEEQFNPVSEIATNAEIVESNTTNTFGTAAVWIGGSDSQNEGTWIWDGDNDDIGDQFWEGGPNGSSVGGLYSNWGTNPPEPDNSGNQDKLTLTIDSSHPNYTKWNDLSVNINSLYFIIEYNTILSNKGINYSNKIHIYPNPFEDYIFIENNNSQSIRKLQVFNNLGQIIDTQYHLASESKINLTNLESGIYYLHLIFDDGSTFMSKIVR